MHTRLIVTALIEQDDRLLLAQLARGRFAGFWLLPSATVEEAPVERAMKLALPERTGYSLQDQRLLTVVEEPRTGMRALRFVFNVLVSEPPGAPADVEIARVCWFSREAACEVLSERDVVPALGVMSLIRGWAEGITPPPLVSLIDDVLCPCGSGFRYPGCCGWDMR